MTESAASHEAGAKVEFARSGKSVVWSGEAANILELADANGIRISSGCRAGNCGTCATAVKQGKVSYLSRPSSKPAQGSALVCIACPDGDIVLDA
jgi:ferredoxin